MKRVGVLALLPFVLFALERVNLIKDASFENNSPVWDTSVTGFSFPYSASVNSHSIERAFTGNYSGSGDSRQKALNYSFWENACISQAFLPGKTPEDLDSLTLSYSILPPYHGLSRTYAVSVFIYLNVNEPLEDRRKAGYGLKAPGSPLVDTLDPTRRYLEKMDFPEDTLWHVLEKNVKKDMEEWTNPSDPSDPPLPMDATLDSLILWCGGMRTGYPLYLWLGQKVFFDDVRLMGYADFDVGVKEITSAEVASPGVPYTPEARIKNFGREDADDFSIILTIEDSTGIMRIDTVPYTLPADTEDTLAFDPVTFPVPGAYNLRIRTEMVPDESDEDDEKSLQIAVTGIEEPVTLNPDEVDLDVTQVRAGFRVSYFVPAGQSGTITLYNSAGQRIESKTVQGAGETVMGEGLSNGVYFVRLDAPDYSLSHKVVVVQ